MERMNEIFGQTGILAQHLPEHEARPGQRRMAEAVAELLAQTDGPPAACLIVEAETGLGKTLAYLLPAALSGQKTLISTNTRNLQDQILSREIPFIRAHLAPDLKAMCVKGRQNYLCLRRWHQLTAGGQLELFAAEDNNDMMSLAKLRAWLKKTTFADRAGCPAFPVARRSGRKSAARLISAPAPTALTTAAAIWAKSGARPLPASCWWSIIICSSLIWPCAGAAAARCCPAAKASFLTKRIIWRTLPRSSSACPSRATSCLICLLILSRRRGTAAASGNRKNSLPPWNSWQT